MAAAMMRPTTVPLLGIFFRLVETRPDRAALLTLVILGYLSIWLAFGLAAHALDYGLHGVAAALPWLAVNGWAVGAGLLAAAGAFQFSAPKYPCLTHCRAPFSFVNELWPGWRP